MSCPECGGEAGEFAILDFRFAIGREKQEESVILDFGLRIGDEGLR